jgi:hypothetical protein
MLKLGIDMAVDWDRAIFRLGALTEWEAASATRVSARFTVRHLRASTNQATSLAIDRALSRAIDQSSVHRDFAVRANLRKQLLFLPNLYSTCLLQLVELLKLLSCLFVRIVQQLLL